MTSEKRNRRIAGFFCAVLSLLFSCTQEAADDTGKTSTRLEVQTRAGETGQIHAFLFDGDGSEQFRERVRSLVQGNATVTLNPIDAGTWDIALVTADSDISDKIIRPVRGEARNGKMWQTPGPSTTGMQQTPELRFAYLPAETVTANSVTTASQEAVLYRNVAKVQVVIDRVTGLNPAGTHTLEIWGTPNTLNWKGELWPDKETPSTGNPLKGRFTIYGASSEIQTSDTVEFIIPAHRGSDFAAPNPTDTTTHKLKLNLKLAVAGIGPLFSPSGGIEIPRVPRVNSILRVRLSIDSRLNVTTDLIDWEEVGLEAGMMQTTLSVDRAKVFLSYRDTLAVRTNAKQGFTVEVDEPALTPWLTATADHEGRRLFLEADPNSYPGTPRTGHILVRADNITKKIPVTQRPE